MSSKGLTIWKCDRCGEEEHISRSASGNGQPKDWHCLRLTRPPKADPNTDHTTTRVDLCASCVEVIEGIIAMTLQPVEVEEDAEPDEGDAEEDDDE